MSAAPRTLMSFSRRIVNVNTIVRTWTYHSFRGLKTSELHCSNKRGFLSDPENTGTGQSGVNFDTLGSWNNRISMDVNLAHSMLTGHLVPEITDDKIAIASLKGRRETQEDRTFTRKLTPDVNMFAIFDGHGGSLCVDYMVEHLPNLILDCLRQNPKDLSAVLRRAYHEANQTFSKYMQRNFAGKEHTMKSGTTAIVCLLRNGQQLVVASVGDSKAIVCRDGQGIVLSEEHHPHYPAEKERIKRAGGQVIQCSMGSSRVNGRLQMSRSLGDLDLKPYGVIADPDIRTLMVRHGSDSFLILTTDGVHYVLSNQEIVDVVCTCKTPVEAANFIIDQALQYGSDDNVTAMIVPFGAWGKFAESKSLKFSFTRDLVTSYRHS